MLKFDEVKASVDLRDYCEACLESRGRGFYVCPKCGSGNGKNHTAAFKVTGDRWHCFACGASGDVFDLAGILMPLQMSQENPLEALSEPQLA